MIFVNMSCTGTVEQAVVKLPFYGNPRFDFVTTEWVLTEVADAAATPDGHR